MPNVAAPTNAERSGLTGSGLSRLPLSISDRRGREPAAELVAGGTNGSSVMSSAEVYDPAPQAEALEAAFFAVPVGESSATQTVVVTNIGEQTLSISGVSVAGADAGDFDIAGDACSGRMLSFEQSCTILVRFVPAVAGDATASLGLADNEPTPDAIPLFGEGIAANSGAVGPQGPAGQLGPAGPTGATGAAGRIELVTCKTVTVTVKHKRVTRKKCTTWLVSGTLKFTTATATAVSASITRGHVTYARGRLISARHGHSKLILIPVRTLRPGTYTLTAHAGKHAYHTQITFD